MTRVNPKIRRGVRRYKLILHAAHRVEPDRNVLPHRLQVRVTKTIRGFWEAIFVPPVICRILNKPGQVCLPKVCSVFVKYCVEGSHLASVFPARIFLSPRIP